MTAANKLIDETVMGTKQLKSIAGGANAQTQRWELSRALELSTALQSTLDVENLMQVFSTEVAKHVPHDSLVYDNAEQDLTVRHGRGGRQSCQYRLLVGGHPLGELTFTRGRRFSEEDCVLLEYMLTTLLYPLRNALLYQQAITKAQQDPLTGVQNRASLDASLHREVHLAQRHNQPLALLVLDVDRFKSINDKFGHLMGDCVLRDIATCASGCIRSSDMLFRYGGEEFVLVLSNTDQDGALKLAERIRHTIERMCCTYGETTLGVTVSLGVACCADGDTDRSLFQRADEALLRAKKAGRNRVEIGTI